MPGRDTVEALNLLHARVTRLETQPPRLEEWNLPWKGMSKDEKAAFDQLTAQLAALKNDYLNSVRILRNDVARLLSGYKECEDRLDAIEGRGGPAAVTPAAWPAPPPPAWPAPPPPAWPAPAWPAQPPPDTQPSAPLPPYSPDAQKYAQPSRGTGRPAK